ncbi:segregation and condensation protein A [Fundicoccus sp. Sow4_H7]|uniref:segregation and condensation protein A n=1 Tax=Fundicoccus sp. Sow4_H7 TaxID=3438784 RepID=UPI003F8DF1EE
MSQESLKLELQAYQGPFDLLLHLIKQLKVDINDIPMHEITTQYMNYLRSMQELELDIAGDYLVMAATLLEIKSRLLLPIEPSTEMDDDYQGQDPRQLLVQQLLLYQQFQSVADSLEEKQEQRAKLYTRQPVDLSHHQTFIPLEENELSVAVLNQAMIQALVNAFERKPQLKEIQHDPITVDEKIKDIMILLDEMNFEDEIQLTDLVSSGSKQEYIATFLAMLELVRKQQIIFHQPHALEMIKIKRIRLAKDVTI